MNAARRYDIERDRQDREHRVVETAQERWPGVTSHQQLAAWFCEDCIKTGCHTHRPTQLDLDVIAADYAMHRAVVHGDK